MTQAFNKIQYARDAIESDFEESRARSLALTKLDEAYMWLDRAIQRRSGGIAGGEWERRP